MSQLAVCEINNNIATIRLDDGNKNVMSPTMVAHINRALDEAAAANAVVVLTGRDGVFSAGFDLKILKTGVLNTFKMITGGFKLSQRLLSFPTPVIIACNGHAMAMGSFLLLSADYRIGTRGDYKIVANEVEIGLTMPHAAIVICRQRLQGPHFDRAVLLSELYNPETAVESGFLDEVADDAEQLMEKAMQKAEKYAELDSKAHRQSKLRMRKKTLKSLKMARYADKIGFIGQGLKRAIGIK